MQRQRILLSALFTVSLGTLGIAQTTAGSGTATSQSKTSSSTTNTSTSTGSGSMVGQPDRNFMMTAAQGGMAEVHLAQLAQQKASSDAVKQYAKMLEEDHTKANNELKQVAQQKGVNLPTDLDAKHQAAMQKLQGLSGDQFDRAYIKMMVEDHKKDVKEFQRQSERGMDSDVKAFASKTLPDLQKHLTEVQQLAANKSGSTNTRARSADQSSNSSDSSAQPAGGNNPTTKP